MSRKLAIAALGVLLILLGIISYVANPTPAPKPPRPKPDPKRMQDISQTEQRTRQHYMEEMRKQGKKPGNNLPKDTMTGDWFRKRSEGEPGIRSLDKSTSQPPK